MKTRERISIIPSRKYYPQNKRPDIKWLKEVGATREAKAIRALNLIENYAIDLKNDAKKIADKHDDLQQSMLERGLLMYDMPVSPEDAGFSARIESVDLGEAQVEKYVYRKGRGDSEVYLWHLKESMWVVMKGSWASPIIIEIQSMTSFLIIMHAIGVEINMNEVLMK